MFLKKQDNKQQQTNPSTPKWATYVQIGDDEYEIHYSDKLQKSFENTRRLVNYLQVEISDMEDLTKTVAIELMHTEMALKETASMLKIKEGENSALEETNKALQNELNELREQHKSLQNELSDVQSKQTSVKAVEKAKPVTPNFSKPTEAQPKEVKKTDDTVSILNLTAGTSQAIVMGDGSPEMIDSTWGISGKVS